MRGMSGIEIIADERRRQIEAEGWTPEHDDEHVRGEMGSAAACYAMAPWFRKMNRHVFRFIMWPWDLGWWKPTPDDRVRELAKAGALCAAEIDRLNRAAGK